jgi:hypothetical protein
MMQLGEALMVLAACATYWQFWAGAAGALALVLAIWGVSVSAQDKLFTPAGGATRAGVSGGGGSFRDKVGSRFSPPSRNGRR